MRRCYGVIEPSGRRRYSDVNICRVIERQNETLLRGDWAVGTTALR
ncbi:MAG: hypothetical protein KIH69_021795 [Anaerolineae bacterium]|nr:hypothetical protein [Anaerolineae bacterium]